MKEIDIKKGLNKLYEEYKNNADIKIILAKACQLGMTYQENKIRNCIDIVFNELHK